METGETREAFKKNLSEQKARRMALPVQKLHQCFSTAPSTGKVLRSNEISAVVVQSLTASTSQLLPRLMESILIRPAACLGTTRVLRLPQHSPCQRSPLRAPDSGSLFKASFQRKVATSFDGLGKRMNGLKLPNWKSQVGFALQGPSTPTRLWVSVYLMVTLASISSFPTTALPKC